jgi:predicted DNA-binding protein
MPTQNPRINITLESEFNLILANLAKREAKSISAMAKELILDALERREDLYFSKLGEDRLKSTKKTYSHAAAWK